MDLKQFGKRIIEKLLEGDSKSIKILREQFESSKVKKIDYTGSGFFIYYSIDTRKQSINKKNVEIGGLCKINDNGEVYDIILFIREGLIDFLEGIIFGNGKFPKKIDFYKFEPLEDNAEKLKEDNKKSRSCIKNTRLTKLNNKK